MTAIPSPLTDASAISSLSRNDYLAFKLRRDFLTAACMFCFFWLIDFDACSLGYLAAVYLLIPVAARFEHGRKWDQAHLASASIRQPGE
jgi:hypothetical protein